MVEMLITVAVLAVIVALLSFPLMAAFGYVQRATAAREAQRAGTDAARKLQRELETATYVYEIPPDGSSVTFLLEAEDAQKASGLPMDQNNNVRLVRYSRMLDFPWEWMVDPANPAATTPSWVLLRPNFWRDTNPNQPLVPVMSEYHSPFYKPLNAGVSNPFLLTRYESAALPWTQAWGAQAAATALDPLYPLNGPDFSQFTASQGNREQLWRLYRNNMISVTPYGAEWDLSDFRVTPVRQSAETLAPQMDAAGRRTAVMLSRDPLWAGRNLDLDAVDDAKLLAIWGVTAEDSTDPFNLRAAYPLAPRGVNPFGYEIRVYDRGGALVYGWNVMERQLLASRHFMEWPPIGRKDFLGLDGRLDPDKLLWTKDEIDRQRLEGKLVFAQPIRAPEQLTVVPGSAIAGLGLTGAAAIVPAPEGWGDRETHLTKLPSTLTMSTGTDTVTFTLATHSDPARLGATEYCLAAPGTRVLAFGSAMPAPMDPAGDARNISDADKVRFWVSDLQDDDMVIATYSTRAVLDIVLTMARQNRASLGDVLRQDQTVSLRVEARNATKRARGNQ